MTDIQKPVREAAIEVSESMLARLRANPAVRDVLEKAGIEAGAEGGAKIVASSPEAAARLREATRAAGITPPSGAGLRETVRDTGSGFQMTGGPVPPDRALSTEVRGTPSGGRGPKETVDESRFQQTGGPVPPDRALSTEVKSGVTVGAPGNPDDAFYAGDPRWGEGRPASGFGGDAGPPPEPSAQLSLPKGGKEAYVDSLTLTRPELRQGLREQLNYAEKMKGSPLTPEEMAYEARTITKAGTTPSGPKAAGPGRDGMSASFDESLDRSMGNLGETPSTSPMSTGAKLGIGAAGLAATGYAASQAIDGDPTNLPAKNPPPSAATTPAGSAPASPKGLSLGGTKIDAPAAPTTRELPHVDAVKMTANKIKQDPNAFGEELKTLDEQIAAAAKAKTTWGKADDATWQSKIDDLNAVYKAGRKRNDWSEVAEKLAHAVTQFGAALTGMRTGVDLSGLKFDKTDWDRRNDRLMEELKSDVGLTTKGRDQSFETVRTARESLDRLMERRGATRDKREARRFDIDKFNVGADNDATSTNTKGQQDANTTNVKFQNEDLDRDSKERIAADAASKKPKPGDKLYAMGVKRAYDLAEEQAKAYGQLTGVLASVQDNPRKLKDNLATLGKMAGSAGINFDDILTEAKRRDSEEYFGKSQEEHVLDILKEKQPEILGRRDRARSAFERSEVGLPPPSTETQPTQPPPAADPKLLEAGIAAVMAKTKVDRATAIRELKLAKKLPESYN